MKNRKKRDEKRAVWKVLSVLLPVGMLWGCGNNQKELPKDSQAYVGESKGTQDDAVNTLQVGSKYKIVTPMMEIKDAVVEILGDNYWPDALLTEEEMAERTGISASMYENFMAEYQHSEAGIDMMIIVEAKEDSVLQVEESLNEYRTLLLKI